MASHIVCLERQVRTNGQTRQAQLLFEIVQPLHYHGSMPVIQRFATCRVRINVKDHPPPHFHVQLNDGREAWVSIDPVEIIHGKVAAREIAEVLAWAREHRALLAQTFEELQR